MNLKNLNTHESIKSKLLVAFLLIFTCHVALAKAQDSAAPARNPTLSTYDLYNPARTPGILLSEGTNTVATGKLKLKSYQLEEVKLAPPLDLHVRGGRQQLSSALRLTVTGESFRCGSYTIWINEQPLGDVSRGIKELVVIVFDRSLLEDGATIAVSCDANTARSILPERLYLPLPARSSAAFHDDGNIIRRIRTVDRGDGRPVIEIEFGSNAEFEVRNEILIVQIGKKEFLGAGSPDGGNDRLILRLTPEQFANINDGEPVIIKHGRGSQGLRGDRKFGQLNKGMLDK
jgi:hypothetical protein